jgi:cobalamin biosynthesis Co2+ chelatase CbiK
MVENTVDIQSGQVVYCSKAGQTLEKQGYQVNVRMQGLGENKAIRQLYMEHIKAMLKD